VIYYRGDKKFTALDILKQSSLFSLVKVGWGRLEYEHLEKIRLCVVSCIDMTLRELEHLG